MNYFFCYFFFFFFFFNDTATTEIYTLSLHDALPILRAERVRHDDDERARRVLLDALRDLRDRVEVHLEEVVAAHAGLAGHAGGHDADVRVLDDGVVGRAAAGDVHVELEDAPGLLQVEGLPLRDALHDVHEDDVPEVPLTTHERHRAADLAGADERDLLASSHAVLSLPAGASRLHVPHDLVAELRALHLDHVRDALGLHEAREVVGDAVRADGAVHPLDDEVDRKSTRLNS